MHMGHVGFASECDLVTTSSEVWQPGAPIPPGSAHGRSLLPWALLPCPERSLHGIATDGGDLEIEDVRAVLLHGPCFASCRLGDVVHRHLLENGPPFCECLRKQWICALVVFVQE